MGQWTGSALVQIMASCLFSAKPLSKQMLDCCQLDSWEQISVKFESELHHFIQENAFEIVVWQNGGHLSRGSWVKGRPMDKCARFYERSLQESTSLSMNRPFLPWTARPLKETGYFFEECLFKHISKTSLTFNSWHLTTLLTNFVLIDVFSVNEL